MVEMANKAAKTLFSAGGEPTGYELKPEELSAWKARSR